MCEIHVDKLCIGWVLTGIVFSPYQAWCDIAPAVSKSKQGKLSSSSRFGQQGCLEKCGFGANQGVVPLEGRIGMPGYGAIYGKKRKVGKYYM
jgi:hypothetical protein